MVKPQPLKNGTIPEVPDYGTRYDWSEPDQGNILGAYYYGYLIAGLMAGWFAENFNTITLLAGSTAAESILILLIPFLAPVHYGLVMAVRIGCGYCGGIMFPACHTLVSKWAPPAEKGKFIAMLLGGGVGNFVTWFALGHLIPTVGWKASCYIVSAICVTWAIIFYFICYQSPAEHPTITETEKEFIERSLQGLKLHSGIKVNPPIGKIFTNYHYLALLTLHFGNDWGLYFILNEAPKFVSEGLHYDSKQAGMASGVPGLFRQLGGLIFGPAGDYLRQKEIMSLMNLRRGFVVFSHILPGIFLVGATYSSFDHAVLTVLLLALSLGCNGAVIHTNNGNNQDLSPNFAGTLYGYANSFGSIAGFIVPKIVGRFLDGKGGNSLENWRKAFWMGAGVYWFTGTVWMIFGSASIQQFNYHQIGKPKIDLADNKDAERPEVAGAKT